jgi:DNA polymerase-1
MFRLPGFEPRLLVRNDQPALQREQIHLIDGMNWLFRAHKVKQKRRNRDGMCVNGITGFLNMLGSLLKQHNPKYLAIAFDYPGKTFRHEIYPEYKANRGEASDPDKTDIHQQLKPIIALLKARGFTVLIKEGYEADDLIGTLVYKFQDTGLPIYIHTEDKDYNQLLIKPNIAVMHRKAHLVTRRTVKERYGITPEQFLDYLVLKGDRVDNVPGVKLWSDARIAQHLASYQSLSGMLEHSEEIKGALGRNLRAARKQIRLMRKVVRICTTVPLKLTLGDIRVREADYERLQQIGKRYDIAIGSIV